LGANYVKHDKRQRYLQIRHTAEIAFDNLDSQTKNILNAYAAGVNAYIAQAGSHLPLEFTLLRYRPRPWRGIDSVLVGLNMAQMLNTSYSSDLRRERVAAKIAPELYNDLYPATFWRDHPPGTEPTEIKDDVPFPDVPQPSELRHPLPFDEDDIAFEHRCAECQPGSNDWVVSGEHTTSGKPLLSNDMHLSFSVPGIWYEAHLKLADGSLNVAGVTLPGLPFVVVGHNDRIAWGFTNVGPDVEDLYVEQLGNGTYMTPQGPKPLEHRHEVIQVAHGSSVAFDVDVTRHGPIITPALENERRSLALKWTIYDPQNGFRFPFPQIDRARDWNEFTQAFSMFPGPGQNVVYADVDGHIGYHATGLVPIRAAGDGAVPVNGTDDAHEWTGYIPFDKLPWSYDPTSGVLATANARVAPNDYPYLITKDWASPYRVERIYQVLQSKPKLSPDDMLQLQTDVYSSAEKFFADRFTYAIDHTLGADDRLKQAADILRNWDGRMTTDSAAAAIETRARMHLFETLLESKLGEDWQLYSTWGETAALENIVNRTPERWLPQSYSDWNAFLSGMVRQSLNDAPTDLKHWRYGKSNDIDLQNPVIAAAPFLKRYAGPGQVPTSGSGTTVKQIGRELNGGSFGPSERFTADFSDWDHSKLNIVTGQSGNFLSPYYLDQWQAFNRGTTFELPFTDAAVTQSKRHELTLVPGGQN
jgi:penicillin amidase